MKIEDLPIISDGSMDGEKLQFNMVCEVTIFDGKVESYGLREHGGLYALEIKEGRAKLYFRDIAEKENRT